MIYKDKEHTFVIYNGKVVAPGDLFVKYRTAYRATAAVPAVNLATSHLPLNIPAASRGIPCAVLEGGRAIPLRNAEVDGDGIKILRAR